MNSTNYHHKNELAMAWNNLSCIQSPWFCWGKPKTILVSLSGQINFHTLTALMGPSGAGKTTLLKCINMRPNSGLTADTQLFVNKYTDLRTCFIMQSSDEHLFMGLTVRESLLFASKIKNYGKTKTKFRDSYAQTGQSLLCLDECPENGSEPNGSSFTDYGDPCNKKGRFDHNLNVKRILSELLLEDCADNSVHTCSGGEQKRLSVGLELVQQNKPNLLCIDEPTSGLDSNASEMVIQCLRQLSETHRMAIVTSIHQPNSLLLAMFDQLYVMSKGGHQVFAGPPNHLRDHLTSCGITCPEEVLPIELLLKISSKFPNSLFKHRSTHPENRLNSDKSVKTLVVEGNEIDKLIMMSNKGTDEFMKDCLSNGRPSKNIDNQTKYFHLIHFYYLLLRGVTCFVKYQWRVSAALAMFAFAVSGFLLYLYGTDIGQESGCLNLMSDPTAGPPNATSLEQALAVLAQDSKVTLNLKCQFFAIAFLQFVSMACTILVFPQEVRIFLNEHQNKWYSTSSYFWSKYMVEIPVSIVIAYVYSFIVWYGTGQSEDTFRYIYFTLITTCGMIIANSTGYLMGTIFAHNFQVATTSGVALFLVLVLLSGFFVPLTIQHQVVKSASYLSFIKLTFESILITIYGFDRCDDSQMPILLHQLKLNDNQMKSNMYWIIGHLIFWRFLALFALIIRANGISLSILKPKQRLNSMDTINNNKSITFASHYLNSGSNE